MVPYVLYPLETLPYPLDTCGALAVARLSGWATICLPILPLRSSLCFCNHLGADVIIVLLLAFASIWRLQVAPGNNLWWVAAMDAMAPRCAMGALRFDGLRRGNPTTSLSSCASQSASSSLIQLRSLSRTSGAFARDRITFVTRAAAGSSSGTIPVSIGVVQQVLFNFPCVVFMGGGGWQSLCW